jgi:hypothetical protein
MNGSYIIAAERMSIYERNESLPKLLYTIGSCKAVHRQK